jgi:hypothetical protein
VADRRCDREAEILDALESGRSPASFGDELRTHAAGCAACQDLIDVAGAVLDDRRALMREAVLPGSGVMWWRTTMRARQEAARAAMRTARLVQVTLVVVAVLVAFALLGPRVAPGDLKALFTASAFSLLGFGVPLLAFVAWLILAPVAVYFVLSEE